MAADYDQPPDSSSQEYTGPSPHPYLHDALLYISNVPDVLTDEHLASLLVHIGPFRPKIDRDVPGPTKSGTIEFKTQAIAEKALATVQNKLVPNLAPPTRLVLSPYPPTNPPTPLPPPSAAPRIVKHLPPDIKDGDLYDIFREFGALASVRINVHGSAETGIVEFWSEDDARVAEEAMHCTDIQGQTISVQIYNTNRRSASGGGTEFSVNAQPFVPSGSVYPYPASTYSSPRGPSSTFASPRSASQPLPGGAQFIHGPGQQVQLAPPSGPGSGSHSGLIDPCNLFCKNLDPSIDSNALFSHFRSFGRIVSARVMRNSETGESRGFGFVSYETPDQAAAALNAMNGAQLGTKQIIVRLHEPKQLRQEKLAARFSGSNGHPRNASGATSPTLSEGGESLIAGWTGGSPRHHPSSNLASPVHAETPTRGRRGSGSYYNAALSGTLNLPMRYDELAALSPVVRQEVLTGELSRRIKTLDVVRSDEVDRIVDSISNLSLSEVVNLFDNGEKLKNHAIGLSGNPRDPSASRSASTSQDSRLLTADQLNATASAPDHPSTPISMSTPPRTASPPPPLSTTNASERERILDAVNRFESSRQEELTELLMSLPKRERAMCLFNAEVLRAKLADAKVVLESMDEDEDQPTETQAAAPVTPQPKKTIAKVEGSPQTPELSSRGPSATSSPLPTTPSSIPAPATAQYSTVASLAKLPAVEVVRLALSGVNGLPLESADKLVVSSTDAFIDSLREKPVQQQKQLLGDKLFKAIKSYGVKGAPKVTIALLDQEDLRALAHLMNSYPSVLKEKALSLAAAGTK